MLAENEEMTLDIQDWLNRFVETLRELFGARLCFVGLQGSYARREASDQSDIDVVVVLDTLSLEDLKRYRDALDLMPHREKICGFISGKGELAHWEKSDLFQFVHDTVPLLGRLDSFLPMIDRQDVQRAILIGAGNLYHACCHNFLHEKDLALLESLLKNVVFTLQAKVFSRTGVYYSRKKELWPHLTVQEQELLELRSRLVELRKFELNDDERGELLQKFSDKILVWTSQILQDSDLDF